MTRQTAGEAAGHPPYLYPDYKSTRLRAPDGPLVILPRALADVTGPAHGRGPVGERQGAWIVCYRTRREPPL